MKKLLLFLFLVINTNNLQASKCYYQQTFDEALKSSEAIFIGKSIKEKKVALQSKGGLDLSYKIVTFEVEKSWKLIDRKFVQIRIPTTSLDNCGYSGVQKSYLIYANQMNEVIYISPFSRTMPVENAKYDIYKLGEKDIKIFDGTYTVTNDCVKVLIIIFVVASFFFTFYYIKNKFFGYGD